MVINNVPDFMRKKREKINFQERFENQINLFGEIIQQQKEIDSYHLQHALELTTKQFYYVQRASLLKFSKTISYNKKTQVYSYCSYVPYKQYSQKQVERLCILNPELELLCYEGEK